MDIMTAYCGLACESCMIHLATLQQNQSKQQSMRESIAEQCSTIYSMKLQAKDITDCDGCRAPSGRLFSGCNQCKIRQCAISKNIESCAFCVDYICERLQEHFLLDPEAHKRLEQMRIS